MKPKFKLRVIGNRPVVIGGEEDNPVLKRARAKFGRPFGHEPGTDFKWQSGPTVLTRWLHDRLEEKKA